MGKRHRAGGERLRETKLCEGCLRTRRNDLVEVAVRVSGGQKLWVWIVMYGAGRKLTRTCSSLKGGIVDVFCQCGAISPTLSLLRMLEVQTQCA